MGSATNLSHRRELCERDLASIARESLQQQRVRPLLLWRVPEVGAAALLSGRRCSRRLEMRAERAFVEAARRLLRAQDRLAHSVDSDTFVAWLEEEPRSRTQRRMALPVDIRGALERITARLSSQIDLPVEAGWGYVTPAELARDTLGALADAARRGERERERVVFLGAVGHELRTPLCAIRGYLETLLDAPQDASTSRRFLQIAQSETLRMSRLVDGVLEFSLLDCSAGHLATSRCDLIAVTRRACATLEESLVRRHCSIEIRVGRSIDVALDEDATTHVLLNLLQNAIEHGKPGGRILVSVARRTPFARLRIDDDGPGVPRAELTRIFQRGARVRPGSNNGFGLGLAIVESIVGRAGGEVRAGNAPLGGARFEVLLPLQAEK